jgi:hypothetical protein
LGGPLRQQSLGALDVDATAAWDNVSSIAPFGHGFSADAVFAGECR